MTKRQRYENKQALRELYMDNLLGLEELNRYAATIAHQVEQSRHHEKLAESCAELHRSFLREMHR